MNPEELRLEHPSQAVKTKKKVEIKLPTGLCRNLTEVEAADFLGVSVSALRKSRMNGARTNHLPPPPFVRLGRRVLYRHSDLTKYLDGHFVSAGGQS